MKGEAKPELTRRGLFGALAGVAAVLVATLRERKPPETLADRRRRRRFWIGHT